MKRTLEKGEKEGLKEKRLNKNVYLVMMMEENTCEIRVRV